VTNPVVVGATAGIITAGSLPLVLMALRRAGILDTPGARSSHTRPTLRGGGVAVIVGSTVAASQAAEFRTLQGLAAVGVPVLLGMVGFIDDVRSLGVRARLGAQLLLGALAILALVEERVPTVPLLLTVVLAGAVWVAGYLNAFNFVDGINGISGVTAAITGVYYAVLGAAADSNVLTVIGAAVAGSSLAFLPYNYPKAVVFLGDSGSYFLGASIALAAVIAWRDGVSPVAVVAPLALYLGDTATTLLRRARRGARLWAAHREHAYQRIANDHLGHPRTTLLVGAATVIASGFGVAADRAGGAADVAAAIGVLGVVAVYLRLPAWLDHRKPAGAHP
jgi:UDP-GlcNAc:undecaprenyl-phosphate GlcNAc-1-phosphate transferase